MIKNLNVQNVMIVQYILLHGKIKNIVKDVTIILQMNMMKNLNVQDDQARQFILKFGLAPDRLEGQVYRSIESTLDNFATELIKSIKFFQTRYPNTPVGGILLSGFAAIVPRFGEYLTAKTGVASSVANPWQRVHVAQVDQQQLSTIASEFATVIGLAQRKNDK